MDRPTETPPDGHALPPGHDHPLHGRPHPFDKLHPALYVSEFIGTFLLVFVGLSVVVALWGKGAPLAWLPLQPAARRFLNGALFGTTGALIAFSHCGKVSGAHINPAVTLAFWLEDKIKWRDALGYVVAQIAGGVAGAVALLIWGRVGASDGYGASVPDAQVPLWVPIAGEIVCTFLLVALIFVMVSHKSTQFWTPLINPPLFAVLTWLEAPLSGASANPARSIGPAVVSGLWHGQWVYFVGPCAGAALAVALNKLEVWGRHRPREARLCHFTHHDAARPQAEGAPA